MLESTDASVYYFCACLSPVFLCIFQSTDSVHAGGWPFPRSWRASDKVQATDEPDHQGLHHPLWHGGTAQVCPRHAPPAICPGQALQSVPVMPCNLSRSFPAICPSHAMQSVVLVGPVGIPAICRVSRPCRDPGNLPCL